MFLSSSLALLPRGGRAAALILFVLLAVGGILVQRLCCLEGVPHSVRPLPCVIGSVLLLLVAGLHRGWIFLSGPAYQTLVRGGLTRTWGILAEGFLLGALLGVFSLLLRPRVKKK